MGVVFPSGNIGPSYDECTPRQRFLAAYDAPETVDQAYRLGARSGAAGHGRLSLGQFTSGMGFHDHWRSLWKAYKAGLTVGRRERLARLRAKSDRPCS